MIYLPARHRIDTPAPAAYIRWDYWIAQEQWTKALSAKASNVSGKCAALPWRKFPPPRASRSASSEQLKMTNGTSVPVWTGSPPVVTPDQPWLAWGITAIILIALLAGSWIGVRHLLAWRASKHAAQTAASGAESTPAASHVAQHDSPASAASGTPLHAPANAPENANDAAPDPVATAGAPTTAAEAAASAAPVTAVTDRFELKVEAAKKTRITVTADKDVVYKGTNKAGENQMFSAADHFQVSAKDAGALRLELNGKAIPPIGPSGHSGKVTLTRDSLKEMPGGGN